ncbi:MAG: hypothetical protein AAB378_03445 [Patescibacteria group bacterium]
MILSSHVVIAAAASAPLLAHPLTAPKAAAILAVSVLSHYAVDAIPHWDYNLSSVVKIDDSRGAGGRQFLPRRRLFFEDLGKAALDGLLGLAVTFLMLNLSWNWSDIALLLWIAFSAVLPDVASMFYIIFPHAPFSWFHKAHIVHTSYRWRYSWVSGALSQVATVTVMVWALNSLFRFW